MSPLGVAIRELKAGGFGPALAAYLTTEGLADGLQVRSCLLTASGHIPTPGDMHAATGLAFEVAGRLHEPGRDDPAHLAELAFETLITPTDVAAIQWPDIDEDGITVARASSDQVIADLRAHPDHHAYAMVLVVIPCPNHPGAHP